MSTKVNNRIFVAGASGCIGRRLCPLLVDDGWEVIGSTRSTEKTVMLSAMDVEPVVVDVFDEKRLVDVIKEAQPHAVIHQLSDLPPGLDPSKMAEARIRTARIRKVGTRNLIAASVAAGVTRLVAQSIAFAYAPGPMPYDEEAPLNLDDPDVGPTARAVASLEQQVLKAQLVGLVLRYGKLYGPGTGFDQPPTTTPVHVDAAAHAARLAVTHGKSGIYNVAEDDGAVSGKKAEDVLEWNSRFRIEEHER